MKFTNFISYYFGRVASYRFPSKLQGFINRAYVKSFKLDMSEFEDVESYSSLNALFTRELKKSRDIDEANFISPSDGMLSIARSAPNDMAVQAKGFYYSLASLIDDEFVSGSYCTIYLSPSDYHRFHAPTDMRVESIKFLEGGLLPVNSFSTSNFKELFVRNERVVLKCKDAQEESFYMVFVGALNVGSVKIEGVDRLSNSKEREECFFKPDKEYKKGEELGYFQMGSTVIMVFEKDVSFQKSEGEKIRFGEALI
ncbi:MAG: archaetidylserine decarboxylase [Campylobacterales bacterium]